MRAPAPFGESATSTLVAAFVAIRLTTGTVAFGAVELTPSVKFANPPAADCQLGAVPGPLDFKT